MSERSVAYFPIDELLTAKRNPKKHAIEDLDWSIKRWGYVELITLDDTSGRIVAGHGRLKALKQMRDDGEPEPKGVKPGWIIPVNLGWGSEDESEAEGYLVASNELAIKPGWDSAVLFSVLDDQQDLEGTGFTLDDLDRLAKEAAGLTQDEQAERAKVNGSGYKVVVNCEDEDRQNALLELLLDYGYDAKASKPKN